MSAGQTQASDTPFRISYNKQYGWISGHHGQCVADVYHGFSEKIVDARIGLIVQAVNTRQDIIAERDALAASVLTWWRSKSAEVIVDDEGSEHGSVFEEPPEFVKLAMQLLPETKTK